jgi:hypothetical protein
VFALEAALSPSVASWHPSSAILQITRPKEASSNHSIYHRLVPQLLGSRQILRRSEDLGVLLVNGPIFSKPVCNTLIEETVDDLRRFIAVFLGPRSDCALRKLCTLGILCWEEALFLERWRGIDQVRPSSINAHTGCQQRPRIDVEQDCS